MSETKERNTHLPEFKAKVGLEAVRGVKTGVAQLHRTLWPSRPDTCPSGGNSLYARDRWGSDQQRSDQFHSIAFHLIVDINVALRSGNALMPNQAC